LGISPSLGESWRRQFYGQIRNSLGLDESKDRGSRDLLCSLLLGRHEPVELAIKRKDCIVFGAGPSLEFDIRGLEGFVSSKQPVIIAADGAADALNKSGIKPAIIVSDLDSCSPTVLQDCSKAGSVFVHAHGDNQDLIRAIVPNLGPEVVGTTQVETRDPVYNYGGFTDGDRACFVVSYFGPRRIVIAGMDFGYEEGKYSVNRYEQPPNPKRPLKLEWGRRSLEYLISESKGTIRFENVTKFGVEIDGAAKLRYEEIT
jgi:2-amino-4-hydroxy-6-hydroxymethyldihydropteridine diphosphokinase